MGLKELEDNIFLYLTHKQKGMLTDLGIQYLEGLIEAKRLLLRGEYLSQRSSEAKIKELAL